MITYQEHMRHVDTENMQRKFKARVLCYAIENSNRVKWKKILYLISYGASIKHIMLGLS